TSVWMASHIAIDNRGEKFNSDSSATAVNVDANKDKDKDKDAAVADARNATTFTLRLAPAHGGGSSHPTVHSARLVLATGGYDRQLPVPGWQLPGVMAAGGIQAFGKQNGMLPGRRFVIAGTGPFLLS